MNLQFKVVLLGQARVGKTSLIARYVNDTFDDNQASTAPPPRTHSSYLSKRLSVEQRNVVLNLWDTAGQERFHSLGPIYYRDADAAILVYDITDADSFVRVQDYVKELRKMVSAEIVLCICGNKCDLERSRAVPVETVTQYAQSVGAIHIATSAKQNKGVEDAFLQITKRLVQTKGGQQPSATAMGRRPPSLMVAPDPSSPSEMSRTNSNPVIALHNSPPKPKGGCC
eukprot:gnl/Hemi2/22953_TR7684_c0_g1_i1.p1 gnl/Hemi2/22953_TR7684_c0_g1~~gnl/Hemi2/22953_TR7684_c0_g1_i1.p1  ORF type:complete len:227 (-),score=44.59 gnl/Hemi2/22953_TR7684_c0_g1_i1:302-982(-)